MSKKREEFITKQDSAYGSFKTVGKPEDNQASFEKLNELYASAGMEEIATIAQAEKERVTETVISK